MSSRTRRFSLPDARGTARWASCRGLATAVVVAIGLAAGLELAHAGEDRLREMNRRGMEAYELLEYEEAQEILSDAIVFAKRNRLGRSELVARVHLNLGIVFFSGLQDENSAAIEFLNAVEIDPGIEIPAAYRTEAMQAVLDEIRDDLVDEPRRGGCAGVTGLQHALIEEAEANEARTVGVRLGADVEAEQVILYYRQQGSSEYHERELRRAGECAYRAQIPAERVVGEFIYYYIAAERDGDVVAHSGSPGTPNIIEVRAELDAENPLARDPQPSAADPSGQTAHDASIFLMLAVGSGGGYVTGNTEQANDQVACCFAPAAFHLVPLEIGYFLNPQTSLTLGARIGFPLGANLPGHATAAPGGLARLRYALSDSGVGAMINFAAGFGVMRNTVPLSEPVQGGDTDTVASGPLLAGAGFGYSWAMGERFQLLTELNAIAGIPVVSCLGDCGPVGNGVETNFALQIDANLGFVVTF